MKHCFYIFSLFFVLHSSLFIQQAEAQSFTSLWKQVKTAEDKDQPKSALAAIEKIERKAEKGQDYGNLLAALMKEMVLQREISPDSLKAAQARLKTRQMKWRENGHGVEAALADLCYVRYANVSWKNDDKQNEQWIDSLLSSPDSALYRKAGKAHEYLPLIVNGFIVISFRIILIPNALVNLIFPPLLLVCCIWQWYVLRRWKNHIDTSDKAYAYFSQFVFVVSLVCSMIGLVI